MENQLANNKILFENLTDKIKEEGQKVIENQRNSMRISRSSEHNNQEQLLINEELFYRSIEEKEKQINIINQVTNQINEISKQIAESTLRTGEHINSIEYHINNTDNNIEKAVSNMKDAKKYNESSGGYSNMLLYTIAGVVCLLIILAMIMPK